MTIRQVKSGWQVNIQPGGRGGKRVKKTLPTKAEAIAWERHIRAKVQSEPDWAPAKRDTRLVADLVDLWFKHHGSGLRDGVRRERTLKAICEAMGNPKADGFSADQFAEYRMKRLAAGVSQNTMNHHQAYLRAVFNECARLGHWKQENPLSRLRGFKLQERELSYLTFEEIDQLLKALRESASVHVLLISMVCLETGARWGEAEELRTSQVKDGCIQFVKTKSTKSRSVPVSQKLETALNEHHKKHGIGERFFVASEHAWREAVKRSKLKLQKGQSTHVLRHSFASHFMMAGGGILMLQRALGHSDLKMTMRYAHLSPEHMQEVRRLNPLALLEQRRVEPLLNPADQNSALATDESTVTC